MRKSRISSPSTSANQATFQANHCWFERFKQRNYLYSLKLKGEQAFADLESAQKCLQKFAEIIARKSYSPSQVLNADESGLF